MEITPEGRYRLDHFMDQQRLELGLTWRQVAARAGISYEVIRGLRSDATGVRPLTLRQLDTALEWEPGSAARVLYELGDPRDLFTREERRAMRMYPHTIAKGIAEREQEQGHERNGKSA